MSQEVIISGKHYDESRRAFVYTLPQIHFKQGEYKVAMAQCNFYNSFFNIDSTNNSISIQFPSGADQWVTVTETIPSGYYTTANFNAFLKKMAYENGLYTSTEGSTITTRYFNLAVSEYEYANTLSLFPVPLSTAPPDSATWLTNTGTARCPKVFISTALGKLFGFANNAYYGTGGSTQESFSSDIVPQIDAISSLIITCNIVRNVGLSNPVDFLHCQSLGGSAFGTLCSSPPHEPLFNSCVAGTINEIVLKLFNQDLEPVTLIDTNALFQLTFVKA